MALRSGFWPPFGEGPFSPSVFPPLVVGVIPVWEFVNTIIVGPENLSRYDPPTLRELDLGKRLRRFFSVSRLSLLHATPWRSFSSWIYRNRLRCPPNASPHLFLFHFERYLSNLGSPFLYRRSIVCDESRWICQFFSVQTIKNSWNSLFVLKL